MKNSFFLAAAMAVTLSANAQSADFRPVLQATFDALDTTMEVGKVTELSNKLVLIAKKYPSEWITNYYAALGRGRLSYVDKNDEKRDADLDEADKLFDQSRTLLGKDNDEILVLGAQLANMRLAVKPMIRFQKYGKIFDDYLTQAKTINPDNPRIYYLQGTSKFYTPAAFGGGAKNAAPYFEKAESFYVKEQHDDIMKPYWGKGPNEYFLGQCNKELKK